MSQFHAPEPRIWRCPGANAVMYGPWLGPFSNVFCAGGIGQGFLVREEFVPGQFTNNELMDRFDAIPWESNRWVPLNWEKLGVLINVGGGALTGTPHLLIYSRSTQWPVT